jgi:hypothetical protein
MLGTAVASPACSGSTSTGTAPKLSASFYNLWASQLGWTADQWEEDLQYMVDVDIEWAFITYTSCVDTEAYTAYCWSGSGMTNQTQTLYKSSNPDYVQVGDDVLGKFLTAASKLNLKVLVGLQLVRMLNVSETAAVYQDLASDLHATYGEQPSFRGFYLTQEWGPPSFVGRADELGRDFLGPISDHIHSLDSSLEVGLSPSLEDTVTWAPCPAAWYSDHGEYIAPCASITPTRINHVATPSQWVEWWRAALSHAPHFSWLFVQDHRGGQQPPQHIAAYYAALGPLLAELKVKFWANAELFHITYDTAKGGGEGNRTRTTGSVERVHRQLMEEAPFVGGFTAWEWFWYLSPTGGVQEHRASLSPPLLHSNDSLSLYRNYVRAVLHPGVPLLLLTAGHDYQLLTPPDAGAADEKAGRRALTDGHAFSQTAGCVGWASKQHQGAAGPIVRISLNLTVAAEAQVAQPFRLVSAFRAYFLSLDAAAAQPSSVSVSCSLTSTPSASSPSPVAAPASSRAAEGPFSLAPVTNHPASGKMVVWDVVLPMAVEASTCLLAIERDDALPVLLAEIEAYA